MQFELTKTRALYDWYNVSGIKFHFALVDSALDEKVPLESPARSPRIPTDPIVDSVQISPTDHDDSVIQVRAVTRLVRVNAAPVCGLIVAEFRLRRAINEIITYE